MPEQKQTNNTDSADTKTPKHRSRANGLLVFGLFAAVVFAVTYRPSIEAVYCNEKTLSPKPEVIMLGASWCPYCYKARKYFVDNKVSYCEYDIEDDSKGEQMYARINTNPTMPLGIPILFIGSYTLSGFDEHSIKKLLSKDKTL